MFNYFNDDQQTSIFLRGNNNENSLLDSYKKEKSIYERESSFTTPSYFSSADNVNSSIFEKMNSNEISMSSTHDIFATTNGEYLDENDLAHDLNVRGSNYGNLSMIDRLRGEVANRLNNDTSEVSLSEMYSEKSLDSRVFGGRYNVTISDIYKDKKLFMNYHGLFTDGKMDIDTKEHMLDYETDFERYSDKNENFILGLDLSNSKSKSLKARYATSIFDKDNPESEKHENVFLKKEEVNFSLDNLKSKSSFEEKSVFRELKKFEEINNKTKKEEEYDIKEAMNFSFNGQNSFFDQFSFNKNSTQTSSTNKNSHGEDSFIQTNIEENPFFMKNVVNGDFKDYLKKTGKSTLIEEGKSFATEKVKKEGVAQVEGINPFIKNMIQKQGLSLENKNKNENGSGNKKKLLKTEKIVAQNALLLQGVSNQNPVDFSFHIQAKEERMAGLNEFRKKIENMSLEELLEFKNEILEKIEEYKKDRSKRIQLEQEQMNLKDIEKVILKKIF